MKDLDEFIKEEQDNIDLEYAFIEEFIKLRKEKKLSQQKVADLSNVIRETIARIENRITSPQLSTLIKILKPLGYTVKIVSIDDESDDKYENRSK